MKSILHLFLFIIFLFPRTVESQELNVNKSEEGFSELNFGIAFLPNEEESDGMAYFPGASFLWGKTIIDKDDFIIEYSLGLAFPSIVTGKFGIGKKIKNTKIIAGIRPYPTNLYLQSSFVNGKNGYLIVSLEYNPMDSDLGTSLYSKALINIGYRWHSKSNKK